MSEQSAEHRRLAEYRELSSNWKRWGPYLAERAWGTVREDYSAQGRPWGYLTHDQARSRAYRWNEDGLGGLCDRNQHICLALALWNGQDPILKERMFGLTGDEGNHGEDVKEYYFYTDSSPTHAYMELLYKYPQRAFPYRELVEENARRSFGDPEYDLIDTGIFSEDRYFDVFIRYAKVDEDDVLWQIEVVNRGPEAAPLWVLPTAWFRNTWSWGYPAGPRGDVPGRPRLALERGYAPGGQARVHLSHPAAGDYTLYARHADEALFTENETNHARLFGSANRTPYVKDAFHRYLIQGEAGAVNPQQEGTKAALVRHMLVPPGGRRVVELRLSRRTLEEPFEGFAETFAQRKAECDAFYDIIQSPGLDPDARSIQRQAFAGMLWSKQLYYYDVEQWLAGDPILPASPQRRRGRNSAWGHLINFDIISMPDTWEYPWYAVWDSAFHCIPLSMVDVDFAKRQLVLFTREWYMHPNGQLPAYEWAFEDVNPPVHAWATWRVYRNEQRFGGEPDRAFLEGVFHKLLLNFTWWVNRKDADGSNIFQGGFLGLDNIGVFDRSKELPGGGRIDQSDGTSWMAAYCLHMIRIALELAREEPVYEDTATKFFEHFQRVTHAMTAVGGKTGVSLWDPEDGFFYDLLHLPGGAVIPLKIRSLVGLIPLIAVEVIDQETKARSQTFMRRLRWFLDNRPHLNRNMEDVFATGEEGRTLFSILTRDKLLSLLRYMLDEDEFLSPYGIRSLSKAHADAPFSITINGQRHSVSYEPAESQGALFGGNSNWRGPIWFPINYLIIEALWKYHAFYGDSLQVECPTGSGHLMTLREVAAELGARLTRIFTQEEGRRAVYGDFSTFQDDPHWRDLILFHEYFHGDTGAGLGAQHQTGWTGLVASLLQEQGDCSTPPGD